MFLKYGCCCKIDIFKQFKYISINISVLLFSKDYNQGRFQSKNIGNAIIETGTTSLLIVV